MAQVTINSESSKGYLLVDGFRIVGYPNNRRGRRTYERDFRRGKGMIKISESKVEDE